MLSIYEDRAGILWLGSYVGVNKYDRRRERFAVYVFGYKQQWFSCIGYFFKKRQDILHR